MELPWVEAVFVLFLLTRRAAVVSLDPGLLEDQTLIDTHYCPYFKNRGPSRQDNLRNCTWYTENSCCHDSEIEFAFAQLTPIPGAGESCVKQLNYLYCYICAPNQNTFFRRSTLTVCEEFCNRIYSACKKAYLKGMMIGDMYSNGREFCEGRRFEVSDKNSKQGCFDFDPDARKSTSGSSRTADRRPLLFVLLLMICRIAS